MFDLDLKYLLNNNIDKWANNIDKWANNIDKWTNNIDKWVNNNNKHYSKKYNRNKNLETQIYWEDLGHKYQFDPKLKYCVYFKGCCCPPHKGHINSIKTAVGMFPGCKLLINQVGSPSRHGTSREFNSELLQKYINVVFLNQNNEIKYMLRATNDEVYSSPFIKSCDVLVVIRGDEIEPNYNKSNLINQINQTKINKFKKYIDSLNKIGIKVDFLMQTRNVNKLSATKFIELINVYKKRLLKNKSVDKELKNLYNFIPDEIDNKTKFDIINKICDFETWAHKKISESDSDW